MVTSRPRSIAHEGVLPVPTSAEQRAAVLGDAAEVVEHEVAGAVGHHRDASGRCRLPATPGWPKRRERRRWPPTRTSGCCRRRGGSRSPCRRASPRSNARGPAPGSTPKPSVPTVSGDGGGAELVDECRTRRARRSPGRRAWRRCRGTSRRRRAWAIRRTGAPLYAVTAAVAVQHVVAARTASWRSHGRAGAGSPGTDRPR